MAMINGQAGYVNPVQAHATVCVFTLSHDLEGNVASSVRPPSSRRNPRRTPTARDRNYTIGRVLCLKHRELAA